MDNHKQIVNPDTVKLIDGPKDGETLTFKEPMNFAAYPKDYIFHIKIDNEFGYFATVKDMMKNKMFYRKISDVDKLKDNE